MEQNKFPLLLSPIQLGNVVYKNRMFSAPTGSSWGMMPENLFSPEQIAYYESKAKGGAATVTIGESIVHSATGKSHDVQFCLDHPNALISLTKFARAVKRHGAVPSAELSHGGMWGGLETIFGKDKNRKAYGPSAFQHPAGQVYEMPKEIITEIVDSFGRGAALLKRAGLEMCMVHAGHGWMLGQFLSPKLNQRTDEFGGSTENRARILIMTLEAIREAVGPGFPIEVRMSGDEFIGDGITLPEAIEIAKLIQDKCDMINVSAGVHENPENFIRTHPSQYLEKGPNVFLAEAIRKEVHVPISTVGGIVDPERMENILATGKADVILLGRPLLADPDFPNKVKTGREKEIIRCLRCNGCFGEKEKAGVPMCTLNPAYTNELHDMMIRAIPPVKRKKVMVIGGGPGGMKAALTAAERGHDVVIYEKKDRLGGALNYAEHVDFKEGLYVFRNTMEYLMEKNNVRVVLNTPATRANVEKEQPDVLLIAVGADPIIPRIPGIDSKKVIHATSVFGHPELVSEPVAVIGGGLVGCETAAYLGRLGKDVTMVEMRDEIAWDDSSFGRAAVSVDMRKTGVKIYTEAVANEINADGLVIRLADGSSKLIPAATVINAAGRRSNRSLFLELADAAPIVEMIGDCRQIGKVTNAVSDGYNIAMDI